MDIKSISRVKTHLKFRELLRNHVENQSNAHNLVPFAERGGSISFSSLPLEDKRELAAAALVSDDLDGWDLAMQLEDQESTILSLVFKCSQGLIKPENLMNDILDAIIKEKSDQFEEAFDNEFQSYFDACMEMQELSYLKYAYAGA